MGEVISVPILAISAGGKLYVPGQTTEFQAVLSACDLASDRMLMSADWGQKLYIADNSDPRIEGDDGSIDATGLELTATGISDWTGYSIDTTNDRVFLDDVEDDAVAGIYEISTVAADKITLASSAGGAGDCSYRIERAAKVYDPSAGTMTVWTADTDKGYVPLGCKLICSYRDRIVLARNHVWYMSRQSDPNDFDYGAVASDSGRAVAGTNSGEFITALIPFSHDYLVMGGYNSLWVVRGDPAYGGEIDNVSRTVGIVDKRAWCRTPEGGMVFLAHDGIYYLPPGGVSQPQSISREKMPEVLLGTDVDAYDVTLSYESKHRGIHIFLTPVTAGSVVHYWMDFTTKSFWEVSVPSDYEPTAVCEYYADNPDDTGVLLGGRDGFIRRFYDDATADEETAITSYVEIGPVMIGAGGRDGMLMQIEAILEASSGDVTWEVVVSNTPEGVVSASTFETGTLSGGLNTRIRPRARGASFLIRLTSTNKWAMEEIIALMRTLGWRRL